MNEATNRYGQIIRCDEYGEYLVPTPESPAPASGQSKSGSGRRIWRKDSSVRR